MRKSEGKTSDDGELIAAVVSFLIEGMDQDGAADQDRRILAKANREDEERQSAYWYINEHRRDLGLPDWVYNCILRALDQPAPGRATFQLRDRWVARAVLSVAERCGLSPTRSVATADLQRRQSACSIVAKALSKPGGKKVSERTVQKIWENSQIKKDHWDPRQGPK